MTQKLKADGNNVRQARDDEGIMIVSAVLENASDGKTATVFANDTDLIGSFHVKWAWNNHVPSLTSSDFDETLYSSCIKSKS